jgi:hypothetical protein
MKHVGLVVLLCVWFQMSGERAFAQGAGPDHPQLFNQRKEIARQYLLAAGIQAPEQLDLAHLPQLRAEFEKWLRRSSQQSSSPNDQPSSAPATDGQSDDSNATAAPGALLKYLHPRKRDRVLRLPQFKADAQEQTKTVFVQTPDQPKPAPARNPDDVLWKYSLSFNFSELSLSSADLATIYGAYGKFVNDGKKPVLALSESKDCKNPAQLVDCLRRVRSQDFFWRAISGFSATLSYGQSPRVQQNIFIAPDTTVAKALHLYSGQIDFDPKSLFPSGTDWDNAAKSLDAFKIYKKEAIGDRCSGDDANCVRVLSAPPKKWGIVVALVPTFSFKVQTQFDFIKTSGGEFIRSPFPENHLWSLAFTADLRRIIPSIKARTDVLTALKATKTPDEPEVLKLRSDDPKCSIPVPEAIAGSFYMYSLSDSSEQVWEFCDETCSVPDKRSIPFKKAECEVNGLALKQNGTLMGYPKMPGSELLCVTATGRDGKKLECEVPLNVRPGGQDSVKTQLLLDYVDIALAPDILLDDKWFLESSRTAARVFGVTKLEKR